jgi:hypothetical protein
MANLTITTPDDCEFGDTRLFPQYYVSPEEMAIIQSGVDCNWLLSSIQMRSDFDSDMEGDEVSND